MNENLKTKSSWGGAREGAGRPKGGENEATTEKKIAEKEIHDRVIRSKESLINSQMNLAQGVQMLYKIETRYDKKGKPCRSKPILVESQEEITAYLADECNDRDDDEYYFITTERPDNRALDSLFDRTFGRAKQSVELEVDDPRRDKELELLERLVDSREGDRDKE